MSALPPSSRAQHSGNPAKAPLKRFGQHWLRDESVLAAIVAAAHLTREDDVLEIGPGTGNLTSRLLPAARSLIAVELDRRLSDRLRRQFGNSPHFTLLEADILRVALPDTPRKVVANIPYNITGPILEKLLGTIAQPLRQFERIVLLLQREVAERLVAAPHTKAYGALSVRVQYLAQCEWVCDVPAKAFHPRPKVESAVVCLLPRPFAPVPADPKRLEALVRLGFVSRRKMLRNNLEGVVDRDRLAEVLIAIGAQPQARAEDLDVYQWIALADALPSG